MNPIELFHSDGKAAGIYYCEACRIVHREKKLAEECCGVILCGCGEPCEKYWTKCRKCTDAENVRREAERFAKADKVLEWGGPVYCEGCGYNDGYAMSLAELEEWLEEDGVERPIYVWTCKERPICNLDLDRIIESATSDNAYEDWDSNQLTGTAELKAAIEKFNEQNKGEQYWVPDYGTALILPKREARQEDEE